jgi:hypothetical protein
MGGEPPSEADTKADRNSQIPAIPVQREGFDRQLERLLGHVLEDRALSGLRGLRSCLSSRTMHWPMRPWASPKCRPIARPKPLPSSSGRCRWIEIWPPLTRISVMPRFLSVAPKRPKLAYTRPFASPLTMVVPSSGCFCGWRQVDYWSRRACRRLAPPLDRCQPDFSAGAFLSRRPRESRQAGRGAGRDPRRPLGSSPRKHCTIEWWLALGYNVRPRSTYIRLTSIADVRRAAAPDFVPSKNRKRSKASEAPHRRWVEPI